MAHAFLPDPKCLKLDIITVVGEVIYIKVSTTTQMAPCPRCGACATRVHSRYQRKLLDLPWQANTVRLLVTCKKLRCDNKDCPQRVFAEPIPTVAARHAQKTKRLEQVLHQLALTVGGQPATGLTQLLGFATGSDALLRRAKSKKTDKSVLAMKNRSPVQSLPPVRVLGVDDFAFKKGHRYGTILVDLEKRKPIDLLPDRDAKTLANWLEAHPGIEIVSRDRASCYAEGIRQGAPQAIQVADRWHLLANLGDALERLAHRHHEVLRQVAKTVAHQMAAEDKKVVAEGQIATSLQPQLIQQPEIAPDLVEIPVPVSPQKERREALFNQVKQLQSEGVSLREIARQMGMARNTVMKLAHCQSAPQHAGRSGGSYKLKPFLDYLRSRWTEGEHNAVVLHGEILAQGFCGSVSLVQRLVEPWREKSRRRVAPKPTIVLSPRRAAWLLSSESKRLESKAEEATLLECLISTSSVLATARELALEFCSLVREGRSAEPEQSLQRFALWRVGVKSCGIDELTRWVTSLEQDLVAVESGISLSWSNGQVEGQVNRLKVLKRQMYGRGSFALLRARVLHRRS